MALSLAELEKQLLEAARYRNTEKRAAQEPSSSSRRTAAAELLRDPEASATGCFRATEVLCGEHFRGWEPETIWLTLERHSVDVPVINRDKILAAATITITPYFWWDAHIYENTALAFNNIVSNPEVIQEATPGQLAWGVYEAELLFSAAAPDGPKEWGSQKPEFDREPVMYTACVLHRAGYVLAPDLLSFAQRELDHLNKDGVNITKDQIRDTWRTLKKQPHLEESLGESALDMALGRLASVELHVQERLRRYTDDIKRIT